MGMRGAPGGLRSLGCLGCLREVRRTGLGSRHHTTPFSRGRQTALVARGLVARGSEELGGQSPPTRRPRRLEQAPLLLAGKACGRVTGRCRHTVQVSQVAAGLDAPAHAHAQPPGQAPCFVGRVYSQLAKVPLFASPHGLFEAQVLNAVAHHLQPRHYGRGRGGRVCQGRGQGRVRRPSRRRVAHARIEHAAARLKSPPEPLPRRWPRPLTRVGFPQAALAFRGLWLLGYLLGREQEVHVPEENSRAHVQIHPVG
mmetsp:Transcript_52077/g.118690  ORF Transcript_52077/g.118690 Transcript_52077/m.118690 type:complete len:255 (+) Transcript_52077:1827-2591(+)